MSTHYTQPTSSATAGPTRSPRTRARGRHRALSTVLAALAAHAIVAVGGGDAHAQPTVPTATFDPPSTAWSSVRDRTGAQFAATFDARVEAGDMVIDLDVDEIDGDYRVGAIFQPNPDGRGMGEPPRSHLRRVRQPVVVERAAQLPARRLRELSGRITAALRRALGREHGRPRLGLDPRPHVRPVLRHVRRVPAPRADADRRRQLCHLEWPAVCVGLGGERKRPRVEAPPRT